MIRALSLFVTLCFTSGCGLIIDGAYLLSSKRYTREDKQSKRTELAQVSFEHDVRVEQGQVWLACEDIERGVDRVWTVKKTYEFQGGIHQAHWLPLILDTVIAGALTIGFGTSCGQTGSPDSCNALWGAVPLWTDAVYSAIRLLTIDPPKLVGKERGEPQTEPSPTANWRRTVACEPDAMIIVGSSAADPMAQFFRVDAWGAMSASEQQRLVMALQREGTALMWSAGGQAPRTANVARCDALRAVGRSCPEATR